MLPEHLKICAISGSRADYGLLLSLLKSLQKDPQFTLQLLVTGSHLSKNHGDTVTCFSEDGIAIDHRIPILSKSDSPQAICSAVAKAVEGFSVAFASLTPDLVLVLGDRYEIFAGVQAALFHKIPVAHIAGGDITEGAYDDAIRHAITKMSHLHFTTNTQSTSRIVQMGENPESVFTVGSPGIDLIKSLQLLDKQQLQKVLSIPMQERVFLVGYHPVTLETRTISQQCQTLFSALDQFPESTVIFTSANADTEGHTANKLIRSYVAKHSFAHYFESLGQLKYLSLLQCCNVVIGNSSSGLYEAPSLGTPTVNIGIRQKGRLKADSVQDCELDTDSIISCVKAALKSATIVAENPYGDGNSVARIMAVLKDLNRFKLDSLVQKSFFEVTRV